MVLLVVACGSDDVDKPRSQQVADVGEAPEDPPPELSGGVGGWTLKIANSGGPWGRSFAVVNDRLGTLEESAFSVEEDRISLEEQECAVMDPGTPHTGRFGAQSFRENSTRSKPWRVFVG
jgi:hypothetical protein